MSGSPGMRPNRRLFQAALSFRLSRALVVGRGSGVTGPGRTVSRGRPMTGGDESKIVTDGANRLDVGPCSDARHSTDGEGGGSAGSGRDGMSSLARAIIAARPACCNSAKSQEIASGGSMVPTSVVAWDPRPPSSSSSGGGSMRPPSSSSSGGGSISRDWRSRRQADTVAAMTGASCAVSRVAVTGGARIARLRRYREPGRAGPGRRG